ncbi:adenylate/guanylate cyclase domain-containing protein [Albimonas sp. CAU 1670]|uniref:adenylate/guanylate cyclase domain-containing protein n=1 Tax=Albimonas sp. CAU 1670 TaxID=3032599 RepID=UPI0023DC30C1|nr:adenylate/guanylate cyclase domain-containing protein [Albimonas sp. CAU 1670]MDF2233951.1 adenylate/guanylate cyclase domain-containing protein [Albimonas sp. CAU 1670]
MTAETVILCAAPYAAEPAWLTPACESALREEIAAAFPPEAAVAYTCPSAGPGLIFAEAALARGAELHLFLPCAPDDFAQWHVAPAGPGHLARFEAVRAAAARFETSGEERLAGDEIQLRFNNQVLQGLARLHAENRGGAARLLACWSPSAPAEPGSPADFMDQWPEIERLSLIDLDDPRGDARAGAPADIDPDLGALAFGASPLVVRAIFFADLATYSTLRDEQVPLLWDFLAEVQTRIEARATAPILINTWGDAVHAAAETATDLAGYAAELTAGVAELELERFGLEARPRFRVALHAGPVYVGLHPLTGRSMIFGHHVNRAARIEAVAAPGEIYASQHFVALLRAEMDAAEHEARLTGRPVPPAFAVDYVGEKELPKKFGRETVYRVRPLAPALAEARR